MYFDTDTQTRKKRGGGAMGASAPPPPPPPPPTNLGSPLIVKKNYQNIPFGIKRNGISVVLLFTFNMVLWVEDPPFIDSCGIFWTKLCDSRYILPNVLHFYLSCFLTNYLQNARNAVHDNQFSIQVSWGRIPHTPYVLAPAALEISRRRHSCAPLPPPPPPPTHANSWLWV